MSAPLGAAIGAAGICLCVASGWGFAQVPSPTPARHPAVTVVPVTSTAPRELVQALTVMPRVAEPLHVAQAPQAEASPPLRLPLMHARVTLDSEARQALAALDQFVPAPGSAPTHFVEVTFGIEDVDVPRLLAERRFIEMVRVLRQRGFWRSQIRDHGWHSNEDAFVAVRVVPWSDG